MADTGISQDASAIHGYAVFLAGTGRVSSARGGAAALANRHEVCWNKRDARVLLAIESVRRDLDPMLTLPESTGHHTGALSIRARAFVFEDPQSRALLSRIERIGRSHAPVLITGETGTGKELVARALHAASERAAQPFVAVNAGAFSEQLIEAELFGHEKGAFTGAHSAQAGWFETAHGGTLFLDEIGDLPLALQVKLLRVLQEGEVTRLGSRQPTAARVRFSRLSRAPVVAPLPRRV